MWSRKCRPWKPAPARACARSCCCAGFAAGVLAIRTLQFAVQLLQLRIGSGKLFGEPLCLPFNPFLLALSFRARFGLLLPALLLAGAAFAADRLEVGLEVIGAVVVVDFLARLDVLDRTDENLALARFDIAFGVRLAGVIDVAGDVLAHRTVDGPAVVEFEQIFVLDRVILLLSAIE